MSSVGFFIDIILVAAL